MPGQQRSTEQARDFAVLLLNWERPEYTIGALTSIVESTLRPGAVVVVDNASTDDSVERIHDWATRSGLGTQVISVAAESTLPRSPGYWLTILVTPSNDGFSSGNNAGLRYLLSDPAISHILLLNNDARVDPQCLAQLDRAFRGSGEAGILTGTILVDSPDEEVWYAGGREVPFRGLTRHVTTLPRDMRVRETEFVSGCAMLLSREALQRVGLLAERYDPGYWEDAEYSRRVRSAGMRVLYVPRARLYHRVGGSMGTPQRSSRVTYVQSRNRLFYIRRNYTGVQRVAAILYNAVTKPGRALLETVKGRPTVGWAVLRGTFDGMFRQCNP